MTFAKNRVLQESDYEELGVNHRKAWEIELALKSLRECGAAGPESLILGVGAATERTIFELANPTDAKFVFATDLYMEPGEWGEWLDVEFLRHPGPFAPDHLEGKFEPWRIIPRHANMLHLPFVDNTFDGIFSSGSIEHVGTPGKPDYEAIQRAASEIGRVLKRGGIASLSTEWKLSGEGWGWHHVRLFDEETIMEHIVNPSGLELVDDPLFEFDGDLDNVANLADLVAGRDKENGRVVLEHNGFKYTSVHLCLRKPNPWL